MESGERQPLPPNNQEVELIHDGKLKIRVTGSLEERKAVIAQAALDVATHQLKADIPSDPEGLDRALSSTQRYVSETFFPEVLDPDNISPDEQSRLDRLNGFLSGRERYLQIDPSDLRVYGSRVRTTDGKIVQDTIDVHFVFNSRQDIQVEADWLSLGNKKPHLLVFIS